MSFASYSDDHHSGGYNSGGYNSAGGGRDNSNDFTRLYQSIAKNVQTITQNVAQIQRMVLQIGTQQDNPNLRDRLHQIQHYTKQLATETGNSMKELANIQQPSTQSEQRERKIKRERLVDDFTRALNNFQAAQKQASEKEKASVARARASSGLTNDPFLQFDERKSDDMLVGESPTSQSIQMEQDVDLQLIQEREQAIRQLESDIGDVNQIFKDLGMLVHEQGEVIDSIESNVETTAVQVESGRTQLQKAQEYQTKARRKKCIILIIVVLALIIIIAIIAGTLSNRN